MVSRFLKTIWFLLAARCRDATRIFSEEHELEVSRVDWWAARLHWISCGPCRRYCQQQKLIDQLLEEMPEEIRSRFEKIDPSWQLSDDAKARMAEAIKQIQKADTSAKDLEF